MPASFEVWAEIHPETKERKWAFWADCATEVFAGSVASHIGETHACETRIVRTSTPARPETTFVEITDTPPRPEDTRSPGLSSLVTLKMLGSMLEGLVVMGGKLVHVDIGGRVYSASEFAQIIEGKS